VDAAPPLPPAAEPLLYVTRYGESAMTPPAKRMRKMRARRRALGLRELRLVVPDARSRTVRRRVARQVARLDRGGEQEALAWIEAVAEFDETR